MNQPLKILFITQEDPFYVKIFFEEFFTLYPHKENILGVVVCPTMGKKSLKNLVRQMFEFYGPIDFARMVGRYLTIKLTGDGISKVCKKFKVPVYQEKDINEESFINQWKERNIDVIVSIAAPQIFKKRLIDLPSWGCINIHHAKLPDYRGMMPNFWQMYHSEQNAGITVHRINPKIDEGEIILQKEVPIKEKFTLDDLIKYSKKIGAQCIIETLGLIQNNKVNYLPNDNAKSSYFSFPRAADVKEFRRRGKRIL
ncbi:MAG: formyl transferase [Omnitrophica WOR_2 bacterium SM23_72]|nr:MAG: formyl transferase [Omnitrophica WOR_2 bacterium SM23_72]